MSNLIRDLAVQRLSSQIDTEAASSMMELLDAAGLDVVPRSDCPIPHIGPERVSVMNDVAVIESRQESYLDQVQLLGFIQDLIVAASVMSQSPDFTAITDAA